MTQPLPSSWSVVHQYKPDWLASRIGYKQNNATYAQSKREWVKWGAPHQVCRGLRLSSKGCPMVALCCSHLHAFSLLISRLWHCSKQSTPSLSSWKRFYNIQAHYTYKPMWANTWMDVHVNKHHAHKQKYYKFLCISQYMRNNTDTFILLSWNMCFKLTFDHTIYLLIVLFFFIKL